MGAGRMLLGRSHLGREMKFRNHDLGRSQGFLRSFPFFPLVYLAVL